MPHPSVFKQVDAALVNPSKLIASPRHWNPGLFCFKGRLWMTYRYHRKLPDSRCGIAICEINPKSREPIGKSQTLSLGSDDTGEHYEDARLFTFEGEPYISYTAMTGYQPGVDYQCVMRYSRLSIRKGSWLVLNTWQPRFGLNNGFHKEKNWMLFEAKGGLYCIYSDRPGRMVCKVDRGEFTDFDESPPVYWPWGDVRGGSPPAPDPEGGYRCFFHSSVPSEQAPHHVRYYCGTYTMEETYPFRVTAVSLRPVAVGSEKDGHRVDPRFSAGWKPFVVFPCGAVERDGDWLVSMGINDWCCAIAKIDTGKIAMGTPDGSNWPTRYFRIENGATPLAVTSEDGLKTLRNWEVPRRGVAGTAGLGYISMPHPREAEEVAQMIGVDEISKREYDLATSVTRSPYVSY